ncbi:MAG: toll/interleukin-1 receptor domain-containing protein [Polyangiales bacterium]
MKIFISWSRPETKAIAKALRDWLPEVIQSLKPWASFEDISAGQRWSPEMAKALEESTFGIFCVTPDNQHDPWISFEAGALAKHVDVGRVCPYLLGMTPGDLKPGPLSQFQAKMANEEHTLEIVKSINSRLQDPIADDSLAKQFKRCWPELEKTIAEVVAYRPHQEPVRDQREMIGEVLEIVRDVARRMPRSTMQRMAGTAPPFDDSKSGGRRADENPLMELRRESELAAEMPRSPGAPPHGNDG